MSSTASSETPEAKEINLVGNVEMRIALTDTDAKLESILKVYLAPLLLKLASNHLSVRNKVISVCQHVSTRIKPASIKLPVAALLKQYKDTNNNLVRYFDLLYIQQGIDRLLLEDRLQLLPVLIQGLAANAAVSATHTASLFNLFLRLLHHLKLPPRGDNEDDKLRAKLGLDSNSQDAEFLAFWIGKLILFPLAPFKITVAQGLSVKDCQFLQLHSKDDIWKPGQPGGLNLIETKVVAAKFLASGAFLELERFIPALLASADLNSRISEIGEDMLKRAAPAISLEDESLIQRLFTLYLGNDNQDGPLPARGPLQIKILSLLCRSTKATTFGSQIIQIIEGSLLPAARPRFGMVSPNQGLESSKVQAQVFSFVNWFTRIGSLKEKNAVAPALVKKLQGYVESQGWPQTTSETSRHNSLESNSRNYAYESIGLLAKACPDTLLEPKLHLLRWLFTSLSCDNSGRDTSTNIEDVLASVLDKFAGDLSAEIEESLTKLLVHQMDLKEGETDERNFKIVRSTRYISLRFANRCLPFHNTKARWIDLLAIGAFADERPEVVEEGKKGLDPHWHENLRPYNASRSTRNHLESVTEKNLPKFEDLIIEFFGDEHNIKEKQLVWREMTSSYGSAISLCRYVLFHQALMSHASRTLAIDANWKKNIDALVTYDENARKDVQQYLLRLPSPIEDALETFFEWVFGAFMTGIPKDIDSIGDCLLELCSLSPEDILGHQAAKVAILKNIILGNHHRSRHTASRVFGILASLDGCPTTVSEHMEVVFLNKIKPWMRAVGSDVHHVHGSVLALAYLLSRQRTRKRQKVWEVKEDEFKFQFVDPTISISWESEFITIILSILDSSGDKELLEAAIEAVDQLSLFAILTPKSIPSPFKAEMVIANLKTRAEIGDEKAVLTLGHFAMQCEESESEDSVITLIIATLYSLYEKRQAELQFAIGAALSCAGSGWESKSLVGVLDVPGSPRSQPRSTTLQEMLTKVLQDCKSTKPALRQGSVIWLLCLVEYCGHLKELQSQLRTCQAVFKSFLSDRDSLNQESASRGLTLVYEKGDKALKDDLVRDLVMSFTGSTSSTGLQGNVSLETELFEPGALPTGDGSVTTYKDIMNLAAEVGDPGLVYRFMSMASNNAIWSSRAAFGRFGLSSILSDSGVNGYLAQNPKLYPALYRYRFDPNANVRAAMNDIWTALVKDPSAVIDANFELIMEDLLKNVLGKEWRVRQASCAAIADLLQGRPLQRYEKYLEKIWELTFKVCDDIKESVRTAAMALARVLTSILTRSLEAESSSTTAGTMLKVVLPLLLSPSGLESGAPEVQVFALKTLLQIIKSSDGKLLRPFLPDLVGRLLGLLSSLEPQAINYIHLNADKYGMTAQQIDDARLSSVRGSPMMEAIERCLDLLDEASMRGLRDSLENAIKTAVGLPSRVGSARVLVSLSTRGNFLFRPYADHFLRLMRRQVLDRNDTISASFAAACGYLARLSSDEELSRLIEHCKKLYYDSDNERHRAISGDIVNSVAKYATDHFAALAQRTLPFIFIAKHDDDHRIRELFAETWNQNVGGSRAVLLYIDEIIMQATPLLDSPRWSIKHTSALAIADVVKSSGTAISTLNAEKIWPALKKAIDGKTWDGKETILEALVSYVKNSSVMTTNQSIADQLQKIFVRESGRNNPTYRPHALSRLGDFIEICEGIDWFPKVYAIVEPVIQDELDENDQMDVDSKSGGPSSRLLSDETLASALKTLLKSISSTSQQLDIDTRLQQSLKLVKKSIAKENRIVEDAILDGEKALFQKLSFYDQMPDNVENTLVEYLPTMFDREHRTEQTRVKAAEAVNAMAAISPRNRRLKTLLAQKISSSLEGERSFSVKQILERAKELINH